MAGPVDDHASHTEPGVTVVRDRLRPVDTRHPEPDRADAVAVIRLGELVHRPERAARPQPIVTDPWRRHAPPAPGGPWAGRPWLAATNEVTRARRTHPPRQATRWWSNHRADSTRTSPRRTGARPCWPASPPRQLRRWRAHLGTAAPDSRGASARAPTDSSDQDVPGRCWVSTHSSPLAQNAPAREPRAEAADVAPRPTHHLKMSP